MRLLLAGLGAAALVFAATPTVAAPPAPTDMRGAQAYARKAPLDTLAGEADRLHPVAMMLLAKRLYDADRRDEAVFWFYASQLRWRAWLTGPGSREQDQFARLFETLGPDINVHGFCNVDMLLATYARVVEWDETHPDALTPDVATRKSTRDGFLELAESVKARRSEIEAQQGARCAKADPKDPYAGDGGAIFGTPQELLKPYDANRFEAFRPGVTTKAEVVKALGKPEWWGTDPDGTSTLGYSYDEKKTAAAILGMSRRVTVSFTFEPSRVLKEISLPKAEP